MEILKKFNENGYFTSDLYHLLARKKYMLEGEDIIPSVYMKEMKMSTTDRLRTLNSMEIDNIVTSGGKPAGPVLLSFTPKIIVFQNYKPNENIVARFSVKNISKAPTFLNLVYKESSFFFIKPCAGQLLSRLAPGISCTFAITFRPQQYEDYTHRVSFYTDVDQYVVPLIAMGPRPIFDFPDEIVVPNTPLKIDSFYPMIVHNVGSVAAGFTMNTKVPFSVDPKSAYLAINDKIDIKVGFKTMRTGLSIGSLNVGFETGETFKIKVSGSTYTVTIELEKQVVRFFDTYNTLVRQQVYKITNKSDHLLTYMCMKNENIFKDFDDKVKLATIYYDLKDSQSAKYRKLVEYDVMSSSEHERVYSRIFFDEIQALVADHTMHFQNMHFSVTPIKGKLWPKKSTELTLTFSPKEIGDFDTIVYLDIDGMQERFPLKIQGISLPPNIDISLETLDMDTVYINETYNYEIVTRNKGHINGVIMYKKTHTLFDSCISCTPEMHCLRPGQKEVFVLSFCNYNQGPFFEEVNFGIRETDVVLKLYLKGTVIFPTLSFSVSSLDFGDVSIGVSKTLEFQVINESVVKVLGTVKIPSDGPEISSIELIDCAVEENGRIETPMSPKEFKIEPSKIDIGPRDNLTLKITLIPNLIRESCTSLELEWDRSDSPPLRLPITFSGRVPTITPAPDINLRVCFVEHTYKQDVIVTANEFYGYFTIAEPQEDSGFEVEVEVKRGAIEPHDTITIPVKIKTNILGNHEHVIRMYLFGLAEPFDICRITGCGVRPIVACTPLALHWGQTKLLTRTHKLLTLCNDSPVYVSYKASMLYRDHRWSITPTEGIIEPEGEIELCLSLCLLDADTYSNKAILQIENVKDILVPLTATGVGTSIVVGELRDRITLGRHFTKIPMKCKVPIKNCGTRMHSLEWSEFLKTPKLAKHLPSSFFTLDPKILKIGSGETVDLTITALCNKVSVVKEMWYLIGSVEGINKKELLMECPVVAEFVDPKIQVSSNFMAFQSDSGPYSEFYKLTDILMIKNISKLPLDIDIKIKQPFSIVSKKSYIIKPPDLEKCACIYYDEKDLNIPQIRKSIDLYHQQKFVDFLTLNPVEPLREGSLEFFENIHKIKTAFHLTHSVEEKLEDQEVMKMQILFDTTKHTSLKTKVYSDLMRIKFKGHKNKDAVRLVGKIHFPNILIMTPRIDFGCIQNGSLESKCIKLQNVTPLLVCYKFRWRKYIVTHTSMPELQKLDILGVQDTALRDIDETDATESDEYNRPTTLQTSTVSEGVLDQEDNTPEGSVTAVVEYNFEDFKRNVIRKIAPMIDTEYNTEFAWTCKLPQLEKSITTNINELFQLTPHRGLLKPNDVQYVHVIFRPKFNLSVKSTLECEVLGGPSEFVTVSGHSSDLMYKLNTNKLNFRIRSFHEDASEKLILNNIALLQFEYKTYLSEPKFQSDLHSTIRDIVPHEKIMEANEEAEINVIVRPGVVGYFQRQFLLEIGHLPFIPIEVYGWGVIPQIYLSLPRPDMIHLPPLMGYEAIPTLTPEYLESINEIFSKKPSEHVNTPCEFDKCFEDSLFRQGWHIVSAWDGLPSIMDIELAIERMLVIQHISVHPDYLTPYLNKTRSGPIPDFRTTPYFIDFGVVITGTSVQCSADIINYGPIDIKPHFARNSKMLSFLSFKLCGKLGPGEVGKLDVLFSPTPEDFTQLEETVEWCYYLEVTYGVTIPLQIKALCALPFLMTSAHVIDFGTVRCGDKVITSIPIRNIGKPTCIWHVVLKLKTSGPNPMLVLNGSGKFDPGDGGWLSVAFKPTMEMLYEGVLTFKFYMNPLKMTIPVRGQGLMPHLHIIGPDMHFPPTLPWAETTDLYFGITNPCTFPIELIFPHSDTSWQLEEDVYQLLNRYYDKPDEMLLPTLKPGAGWPEEILHFYENFHLRVKRTIEEEAVSRPSSTKPQSKTKAKSPKVPVKSNLNTKESLPTKVFRTEAEIIADVMKEMKEEGVDPLKECVEARQVHHSVAVSDEKGLLVFVHGSPAEEEQGQEIAYALGKKLGIPTINIDLCIVEALLVCDNPAKELIMAALNEYYDAVYKESSFRESAVRESAIKVSSVKISAGKESAIKISAGKESSAIKVSAGKESSAIKVSAGKESSAKVSTGKLSAIKESDLNEQQAFPETEDEFDIIQKKLEYLANGRNAVTPRSKASDKKKTTQVTATGSAVKVMGSTTLFQMDLLQILFTEFFSLPKFNRGFVVDSLTSSVFKSPPLALTTILQCKRSIRNYHLVLCQGEFAKWGQAYEEKIMHEMETVEEPQPKIYSETEIEEIIQMCEDMDEQEYDNLDPEIKAVYINYGLEHRKQKYRLQASKSVHTDQALKRDRISKAESKPTLTSNNTDPKKKPKREDFKWKPTPDYILMSNKYTDYYKNTYENLIQISVNWVKDEYDVGSPLFALNGNLLGATQKKIKKKSDVHLTQQVSEIDLAHRGFPITFLTCDCLRYKDAVVNMLKGTPLVRTALKEEEKFDILKCPVDEKDYTVLIPKFFPTIHHDESLQWLFLNESPIRKCECNQITDLNLLDDSNQDNVLNIISKWHCICGKKVTSSQTSTSEIPSVSMEKVEATEEDYLYPMPLRSVKTIPAHSYRLVLQPGDLVRCKYSFSPKVEGNFSVKRFIEISGWPNSRVDVSVNGICDIPRLDNRPKKMFENFVRRTLEDHVYKLTYLDDQKLFEFGPIFIGSNRIYEEEYKIDLKNSSLLATSIEIEFEVDTNIFEVDKRHMNLEPGCKGKLTITAAPNETGVHNATILFCIKDNPEIIRVKVSCSGVVPILQILPETKIIDYGKHLLYRREDDRFIIKNDSILPVMWKIRNAEEFVQDFIISEKSGIIPRHDNQVVPVTYIACNVGVITSNMLIIDVFDALGRGDPMHTDVLYLSAECYDVMVECSYENHSENFLNFGNVKVNSTVYREMYLVNKGKYNIFYKLKKVKNFPEPTLLRSFEATSECGVILPGGKAVVIGFECTPVVSMNLANVPAFTCSLMDGSREQVVVAKFPVCVSIASFYNTFTLFPLGELNFHIIPVGSGVTRDVILNNTSKCPFTYEIILPSEYQLSPEELEMQQQAAAKSKDSKLKQLPLRCGSFLILNEDNLLTPGANRTIQIQFMATAPRMFEETIHFIISDTCPSEAQGVPLKLVGTGAMPKLDFWNVENTFREHLIVKNLSDYKVHEYSPHCVFVEDSVTLYFFSVTINTSYIGGVHLYNDGLVPCILTMKLHYQNNTSSDIFSLDKYDTYIEPLMHKRLLITFSPKSLQEYRAVLEIKLKALQNQEVSFKLCVIGEGVIPRIRLLQPPLRQHKLAVLNFPVTCLGSVTTKGIRLKNISTVTSQVILNVLQPPCEERPVFWLNTIEKCDHMVLEGRADQLNLNMTLSLKPEDIAKLEIYYNPINKGKTNCDVKISIADNPYEYVTVLCEAEAFMEDVILIGLEMLSMDVDLGTYKSSASGTQVSSSGGDSRKKTKSAPPDKRKKADLNKKPKKTSQSSMKQSDNANFEPSDLKYIMEFGGCELCTMQKRTIIMVNNSEKVYKFSWMEIDNILVKPSVGYISPGEEKDLEITFFSAEPVVIKREAFNCSLVAVSDDSLTVKGPTWDNRQTLTIYGHPKEFNLIERYETVLDEQAIPQSEDLLKVINIFIIYSVITEYSLFTSTLPEEIRLLDTFIYQNRMFDFQIENTGNVPMKIAWSFYLDDDYPFRIDKKLPNTKEQATESAGPVVTETFESEDAAHDTLTTEKEEASKESLFSGSEGRASVDTWFEVDLPFKIEPAKACLRPHSAQDFKVIFSPVEAFEFKVRLKSEIDNLDPYDQNMCCKILAKSLIPYVHLDIEENDYLESERRKSNVAMPLHTTILEFDVLGSGCYKREFNVINPTSDGYEFIFEQVTDKGKNKEKEKDKEKTMKKDKITELVPVHCNMLKGFVEGGTSQEVVFTFSPTCPGVFESHWKFIISTHNLKMDLLVVGIVREPNVVFMPTILIIKYSLVGFTVSCDIFIKNDENQSLNFEFKGNSLCDTSGRTPIVVTPENGILMPCSETPIKIDYTPTQDGPLSFKIYCQIQHSTKFLTLCVNALSLSISPEVSYYLIGNEHILNSDVFTNIHLDRTASTYERTLPFTVKNKGSATFFYDWNYASDPVKKYLKISVKPKNGHLAPGTEVECVLHFQLTQVPVVAYPLKLTISDGPEYQIYLHAEIEKPCYHFSCKEINFGKCIVNAPDVTYKKCLGFTNDDVVPIILTLDFVNSPELYVDYTQENTIAPQTRIKIPLFFRPKQVKEYDIHLPFWVNSLCAEKVIVRGEGVPLLIDLYEGCQKSFDLGPVKVGDKSIRAIEVMNHSKVQIYASFFFKHLYHINTDEDLEAEETESSEGTSICLDPTTPLASQSVGPSRVKSVKKYNENKEQKQVLMDVRNALSSLRVVPSKCRFMPHEKVELKIHFKPVGLISKLAVQLNCKVLKFVRPIVNISGSATGLSLRLSQASLQFGRVRKRGCRVMKVMLHNEGDFGARFWWQPFISDEFKLTPMYGVIAARTNVTFTITFRPINHNPFIKVWACCNIENYKPLELAMYATCLDMGNMQTKSMYLEIPVREVVTEYINITNPTDDPWHVLSEFSEPGGPFETLREFTVAPNDSFDIPVHFKPKTMGKHEAEVLYSPLGESALFVSLIATATYPNANGNIVVSIGAKKMHSELLSVHNITEFPEWYLVTSEVVRVTPPNFEGFYEIKQPERLKVWGEARATCTWSMICYEPCEMQIKVLFINEKTREYQYYNILVTVNPSEIMDCLLFVCHARESMQQEVVVRNPLGHDAQFHVVSDKLDCPEVLNISRNSQATLIMVYSPLVVGETVEYLTVNNELAGSYVYKVTLRCLPAKEKDLEFCTPLGTCIPIRLRVQNRTDDKTDFAASVTHSSIMFEKSYSLNAYEKGKLLLWFEPTELGVQNNRVTFTSPVAGEFVFNIRGVATHPKPQGPFDIKAGSSRTIIFKNVFDDTRTFKIYVDREDFFVKTLYEPIKTKKDMKVVVYLSDQNSRSWAPADFPTGCLTIECYDPPEPKVQWTFFLQGV